jgi:hypothetical protein
MLYNALNPIDNCYMGDALVEVLESANHFGRSCAEISIGEYAHCGELEIYVANAIEELSSVKIILNCMQLSRHLKTDTQ